MDEIPLRFTQDQFDAFGRISGDLNPIHVDPAFSAATRFGRTVAHGMMLFSVVAAAVARRAGRPVRITGQELMFSHPTYAGVPHLLRLGEEAGSRVDASIVTEDGTVTLSSTTWMGGTPSGSGKGDAAGTLGSLRVGDEAVLTRRFETADTRALTELVDDPNPLHRGEGATVPPALLGGLISCLLGMHLPGQGTNWLKQRYRFHAPAPIGSEVTGQVRIVRVRPEKRLVDLATDCLVDGEAVMTGEALVLVRDLRAH